MGTSVPRRSRSGQALTELAIGLLAFALVITAILGFAKCIVASLDMRRSLRADAGRRALGAAGGDTAYSSSSKSVSLEVSPLAADGIFGTRRVEMKEEVHIPHAGMQVQ